MKEQLASLLLLPKGTQEDTYDHKGNLVFSVTTVDNDGNTINDDDHTDSDSKFIISHDDNVIPGNIIYNYETQSITYDNDTIPNGIPNDTPAPYHKSRNQRHGRRYKALSAQPWRPRTNKHKHHQTGIHSHLTNPIDSDDDSAPGIQISSNDNSVESVHHENGESITLHQPTLVPLNQNTKGLTDSMYMTFLEDDTDGDFFFDALEEIDSSLDVIKTVDVGHYTFSFEDPFQSYSFSDEGSSAQHGERIYRTTLVLNAKFLLANLRIMVLFPTIIHIGSPIFQIKTFLVISTKL